MRRRLAYFVALSALVAAPSVAHAQPARRPNPRPRGGPAAPAGNAGGAPGAANEHPQETLSLRDAREALRATDPERIIQGIDSLTVIGNAEAVQAIVELLRNGPVDRVTNYAVEKLGIIGEPSAIEELSNQLHHRRVEVRRTAIRSLAQIRDPRVRGLIESGLHDSDAAVRGQAAQALGEINARQSVPLLFRAFERGVSEAAAAIGRLGDASTAVSQDATRDREDPRTTSHQHTLAMWLTRAPLSVLLEGFRGYLNRSDIAAATKVQIIVRLEQQGSAQVRDFLQRWVSSLPPSYRGPDRARAELAIQQIRVPTGGAGGGAR